MIFIINSLFNDECHLIKSLHLLSAFQERLHLVDKLAKERQQKLTQQPTKDEETSEQNQVTLVEPSRSQGGK